MFRLAVLFTLINVDSAEDMRNISTTLQCIPGAECDTALNLVQKAQKAEKVSILEQDMETETSMSAALDEASQREVQDGKAKNPINERHRAHGPDLHNHPGPSQEEIQEERLRQIRRAREARAHRIQPARDRAPRRRRTEPTRRRRGILDDPHNLRRRRTQLPNRRRFEGGDGPPNGMYVGPKGRGARPKVRPRFRFR